MPPVSSDISVCTVHSLISISELYSHSLYNGKLRYFLQSNNRNRHSVKVEYLVILYSFCLLADRKPSRCILKPTVSKLQINKCTWVQNNIINSKARCADQINKIKHKEHNNFCYIVKSFVYIVNICLQHLQHCKHMFTIYTLLAIQMGLYY